MSELLSIDEAAEILRRPIGTLRNWRYRGEGPLSFKVGRNVMYRRSELDRWLKVQEAISGRGGSNG